MFNPDWLGKIDLKKGLYASKNRKNEDKQLLNNINENTKLENNINEDNKDNKNNNKEIKTITNETQFNYNKNSNLEIPYYNETINYMNSKVSNKYDNNYYHLLDRIGSISRFLLKGNDYYKSYISKNANKYHNDKQTNDKESNNREKNDVENNCSKQQYTKLSLNIKYQEIDKTIINEDQYDE